MRFYVYLTYRKNGSPYTKVAELRAEVDGSFLLESTDCKISGKTEDKKAVLTEHFYITARSTISVERLRILHLSDDTLPLSYFSVPFSRSEEAPSLRDMEENDTVLSEALIMECSGHKRLLMRKPSNAKPTKMIMISDGRNVLWGSSFYEGFQEGDFTDLEAGETLDLGTSRYVSYEGSIGDGLLLHRAYMKENGVALPENYDPPLNYCMYYECGGYWTRPFLDHIMDEARELGCDLLYLDQGWETYGGSGIWDEPRLGTCRDFVSDCAAKGLKVGGLVKMHCKARTWNDRSYKHDENGNILIGDLWADNGDGDLLGICSSDEEWQKIKTERLKKVSDDGIAFFSFDFNDYNEEWRCCDRSHAHSEKQTLWEHASGVARQQAMTKACTEGTLIEVHDWISAGGYRLPIYIFPETHHERWGFEYMWKPAEDYRSGRLFNLYWYNMAYEKPLYLHFDMLESKDVPAVFWYMASTVRHLGIGNYEKLDAFSKDRYIAFVEIYKKWREYFTLGTFYGEGPLIHYHELPEKGTVALFFNNTVEPMQVRHLVPSRISDSAKTEFIKGDASIRDGVIECVIPAGDVVIVHFSN